MFHMISAFTRDDAASVYIEYGMIALLVGVVVMNAVDTLSGVVGERYHSIAEAFTSGQSVR